MTMRHIEMHLIEDSHDLVQAERAGLEINSSEICETCFTAVGDFRADVEFKPFLLCLDDEAEWIVCKDCASPVL